MVFYTKLEVACPCFYYILVPDMAIENFSPVVLHANTSVDRTANKHYDTRIMQLSPNQPSKDTLYTMQHIRHK